MIKIGKNISDFSIYSCQLKTNEELKSIIDDRILKEGPNCDLNDIDVSLIEDMSELFAYSIFNGDISEWDMSNVIDMNGMFLCFFFNQPIGDWDVSKVKKMDFMFCFSNFNQDISKWKIDKDCNTDDMFEDCPIRDEYKPKL